MSDTGRRTFLKQSTIALSGLAVGACSGREDEPEAVTIDAGLLRAVGRLVLPTELGEGGVERAVSGFESWLLEFEPVAELPHGYGSPEVRYGPPDPGPRWGAQLEALEIEASKRFGAGYAELDQLGQQALLERQLAAVAAAPEELPGQSARAEHVAVGLLVWFYGSSDATDLCYGRRIGAFTCRPLAAAPEEPTLLGDGT
jgi:hypothetical protein